MASKTAATEAKRANKKKKSGKKRKGQIRTRGSTKPAKDLFGDKG